jgi:hypothetical protein
VRPHQTRKAATYAAGLRAGTFDAFAVLERIKAIDWAATLRGAPGNPRPTRQEAGAREALIAVLADHGWELIDDDEAGSRVEPLPQTQRVG